MQVSFPSCEKTLKEETNPKKPQPKLTMADYKKEKLKEMARLMSDALKHKIEMRTQKRKVLKELDNFAEKRRNRSIEIVD